MAKESKYASLLTGWERMLAFLEGKSEGCLVSAFWRELIERTLPVESGEKGGGEDERRRRPSGSDPEIL
jgi:hypothetical protein